MSSSSSSSSSSTTTSSSSTITKESKKSIANIKKHLAFISHHKLGFAAGSAWLIKDFLEEVHENDDDDDGLNVFVDQEDDHVNIITLLQELKLSKVVVLLLSKNVFFRLYCLFEIYCAIGNNIPIVPILINGGGYDAAASEKFLSNLENHLDEESLALINKYGLDVVDISYKLSCIVPTFSPLMFSYKESKKVRQSQLQAIKDAVHSAKFHPLTMKKEDWLSQRSGEIAHAIPIAFASVVSVHDESHQHVQAANIVSSSDLTIISSINELESGIMGKNYEAVAAVCDYLYEKSGGDKFNESDSQIRSEITNAGAIQVVVLGLEQFMGSSNISANVGLIKLFRNLARNDENKIVMMDDVSTVFADMVGHMQYPVIQLWGCLVIMSLGVNDENRSAMVKMGAGDIVIQAIKTHKNDLGIQCNGCGALATLALNVSCQGRLLKIGAGETILKAMERHKSNVPLLTQACTALFYLTTNPENKVLLITMGAGDEVIEALNSHPFDTELQKFGCAFIYNASMSKSNIPKLNELRAKDIIQQAMKHHSHVPSIHEFGEKALDNLSKV